MSRGTAGRAVGVGLAAFGLLAAGTQVQSWLPGPDDDPGAEPHRRAAGLGEPVDLRAATVVVHEVSGSATLVEYGAEKVSPGVWVGVDYTVTPRRENASVTFVEVEARDGRTWGLVGRGTNACTTGPPGVDVHCAAYLEVPPEALPGLRLRLATSALDQRYDAVAEVDLGLTDASAADFRAAEPLEARPPRLGGERPR